MYQCTVSWLSMSCDPQTQVHIPTREISPRLLFLVGNGSSGLLQGQNSRGVSATFSGSVAEEGDERNNGLDSMTGSLLV